MPYPTPRSRRYVSQGLALHYVEWGDITASPLLLVHGEGDHCRSWDWVVHALVNKWRVIVPDLRGHGDSAKAPDGNYPYHAYVYDLAELVRQTCTTPVSIVGHSMGGSVVLRYAAAMPGTVTHAVIVEGLGLSPHAAAKRDAVPAGQRIAEYIGHHRSREQRVTRTFVSVKDAAIRLRSIQPFLSAEQSIYLARYGTHQADDGLFRWKFDRNAKIVAPIDFGFVQMQDLWRQITARILLVQGRDSTDPWSADPATDGRIGCFRDASSMTFERAGHWVQHDQTEAFTRAVEGFLVPDISVFKV